MGPDPGHPGAELGFRPVNDLEGILVRCVLSGARATLLRALARSTLCVPVLSERPGQGPFEGDRTGARPRAGEVRLPCVTDSEGKHALVYTSYRQMALAHSLSDDAPWTEVPVGTLFEKWPPDVDAWLNGGGELGFPLDPTDISTVADLAAGLEVDEAYEIGPDDAFSDFPGPAVPDQVDCAVVLALFEDARGAGGAAGLPPAGGAGRPHLADPAGAGRPGAGGMDIAQTVADAVNEASDECCEVHVADVHDDEVYDAVAHFLQVGVPLWRRQGLQAPDTLEGLDGA